MDTSAIKTNFQVGETGSGHPVSCIHGNGLNRDLWRQIADVSSTEARALYRSNQLRHPEDGGVGVGGGVTPQKGTQKPPKHLRNHYTVLKAWKGLYFF